VGAAIVHAMAALPWVVFLAGVGFRTVEPELEEVAVIEMPLRRVFWSVTVRRSLGAIGAAALAVAILTAGDMTVTDLLQVRTYAEEAYVQFMLGNGPADAAVVSLPPLCVLGGLIFLLGRSLLRDSFKLQTAFHRSKVWPLGRWRFFWGVMVLGFLGNLLAVPFYSLVWRAGRVGGNARLALPPSWSFSGLAGTLRFAATESWEPLKTSILLAVIAATLTVILAWSLAWLARTSRAWQVLLLVLLALTLAVPGPVAGMSLTLGYRWFPVIYDSRIMVVFAQSLRALPYAILILWPAMLSLPRELIESAMVDGLSPPRLVARVGVPLTAFASLVAWCVVLILAVGELPATNIVQPPGTMTITFLIWSLLHTGVESHLTGVALVLLFAFAVLMAIAGLGLSGWLWWRLRRSSFLMPPRPRN
jgi:iron(III) transport system permease protein